MKYNVKNFTIKLCIYLRSENSYKSIVWFAVLHDFSLEILLQNIILWIYPEIFRYYSGTDCQFCFKIIIMKKCKKKYIHQKKYK